MKIKVYTEKEYPFKQLLVGKYYPHQNLYRTYDNYFFNKKGWICKDNLKNNYKITNEKPEGFYSSWFKIFGIAMVTLFSALHQNDPIFKFFIIATGIIFFMIPFFLSLILKIFYRN